MLSDLYVTGLRCVTTNLLCNIKQCNNAAESATW